MQMTPIKPSEDTIRTVSEQQRFLEQLAGALAADYCAGGGQIYCARGCSSCCTLAVSCTYPEALLLAHRLDEEQLQRIDRYVERLRQLVSGVTAMKEYLQRHRHASGGCPLLGSDGACTAYGYRPFSCRALLATQESRWCGADFSVLTTAEKGTFLASLDRGATAFPLHYLAAAQDAGSELERQTLLTMSMVHRFSLYGNMPLLVHLTSRRQLAGAVAAGAAAVRELLKLAGLEHPLLLQLEEL